MRRRRTTSALEVRRKQEVGAGLAATSGRSGGPRGGLAGSPTNFAPARGAGAVRWPDREVAPGGRRSGKLAPRNGAGLRGCPGTTRRCRFAEAFPESGFIWKVFGEGPRKDLVRLSRKRTSQVQ